MTVIGLYSLLADHLNRLDVSETLDEGCVVTNVNCVLEIWDNMASC